MSQTMSMLAAGHSRSTTESYPVIGVWAGKRFDWYMSRTSRKANNAQWVYKAEPPPQFQAGLPNCLIQGGR